MRSLTADFLCEFYDYCTAFKEPRDPKYAPMAHVCDRVHVKPGQNAGRGPSARREDDSPRPQLPDSRAAEEASPAAPMMEVEPDFGALPSVGDVVAMLQE
jgi:hypothetical protein